MAKFLIPIVAAVSAVGVAAPASAQWAPPVYNYQPYSYGYGFNNVRFAQSMQARVQRIRNDIHAMTARRILGVGEGRALDRDARELQRRIYRASRNGIQVGEARRLERGIRQLEQRVAREARDWDGRPGRHRRY